MCLFPFDILLLKNSTLPTIKTVRQEKKDCKFVAIIQEVVYLAEKQRML